MISKNVSQIFKILFQTGNSNISVLRGVLLNRFAQLKSYFSEENTSAVKSEPQFCIEAINV